MDMDVVTRMTQESDQPGNNNTPPPDLTPLIQPPPNGLLKPHRPHVSFKECLKNHAASIGGHALDGCREFMPSPATIPADPKSITCDACGCHRNFHRRCYPHDHDTHLPALPAPRPPSPGLIDFQPLNRHQPPPPPVAVVPLAAAPPPRSPGSPSLPPISSTYYSLAMRLPTATALNSANGPRSGQQKRFRTKFSPVQKEKMLEFAEKASWRMQRSDPGTVRDFCDGIGVTRNVFKVWMHNNKNTLGKKSGGGGGSATTTNGTTYDFPKNGDSDYGRDHGNAAACGNNPGCERLRRNGSPSSS